MDFSQKPKRIVVKIGTSTITHATGKLNLRLIEKLARTLSDIRNDGCEVVLVSSGAVSAGMARMSHDARPDGVVEKQALAAVGQCELMKIYEQFFSSYGYTTAQILITKDVVENKERRENAEGTFACLLKMGCVPIVNENDSVSSEGLQFGDNDTVSAYVAQLVHADLLIILSDVDGVYSADPRTDKNAKLIEKIDKIDDGVYAMASGAGTSRGTGGMISKFRAAELCTGAGVPMMILNGEDPAIIYQAIEGKARGTLFTAD